MIKPAMQIPTLTIAEHLCQCARRWTETHNARPTSLGYAVARDGKISQRLLSGQGDVTTGTLEKFAAFFADPANWPEGDVPAEAAAFAHRVGVSAATPPVSSGKARAITPEAGEAERAA